MECKSHELCEEIENSPESKCTAEMPVIFSLEKQKASAQQN